MSQSSPLECLVKKTGLWDLYFTIPVLLLFGISPTSLESKSCTNDLINACSKVMALILFDFHLLLMLGFFKNKNTLPFNIFRYYIFHQDRHSHIINQEMPALHNEQQLHWPLWKNELSRTVCYTWILLPSYAFLLALHFRFSFTCSGFLHGPSIHEARGHCQSADELCFSRVQYSTKLRCNTGFYSYSSAYPWFLFALSWLRSGNWPLFKEVWRQQKLCNLFGQLSHFKMSFTKIVIFQWGISLKK